MVAVVVVIASTKLLLLIRKVLLILNQWSAHQGLGLFVNLNLVNIVLLIIIVFIVHYLFGTVAVIVVLGRILQRTV